MKISRLVCLLIGLSVAATALCPRAVTAAADPADQFLDAYILIQEADAAERQSQWTKARAKYGAALDILHDVQKTSPSWNPHILEFRVTYCSGHLKELESKVGVTPAAAAPAPGPSAESERVQQLTTQLTQAQEQIRQLEAARDALSAKLAAAPLERPTTESSAELQQAQQQIRQIKEARDALQVKLDDATKQAAQTEALAAQLQQARDQTRQLEVARDELNARLQEALRKLAPTETSPQVEELLKQNRDLAAQLAEAQTELAKRSEPPAAPAGDGTVMGESAEVSRLRAELTQTRQQLSAVRKELETAKTENSQLRRNYDDVVAQLTDANRKLSAARASAEKGDQIIAELRKENALLRVIVDRKTVAQGTGRSTNRESRGWFWRRRAQPTAKPEPAKETETATSTSETSPGKLVATLKAPPPPTPPAEAGAKKRSTQSSVAESDAASITPETRAWLSEAREAFAAQDYNTAAARYDMVLAQDPNNLVALSNLGVVRYQQGRFDEAEESLRKAAAAAPNDSKSRALLGIIYFRKGRLDDAFSELTRAVALDPRNAEAHNYLGITLSEKTWTAAAEQEIRKAIELNPQYADAHFNMAVLYAKQRNPRPELARYHYQKARDLGAAADPQLELLLKPAEEKPEKSPTP